MICKTLTDFFLFFKHSISHSGMYQLVALKNKLKNNQEQYLKTIFFFEKSHHHKAFSIIDPNYDHHLVSS